MKIDEIGILDKMLIELTENHLGDVIVSTTLLNSVGFDGDFSLGLFFIEILIDDGYVKTHFNQFTQYPVLTISPKGFRFIATGGYAKHMSSSLADLEKEQTKLHLEIKTLKYGFWISFASLIISIAAIVLPLLYKY